jgi:hypothetical protein
MKIQDQLQIQCVAELLLTVLKELLTAICKGIQMKIWSRTISLIIAD